MNCTVSILSQVHLLGTIRDFPDFIIYSYKILAQWEAGVWTDEQFTQEQEENKENNPPLNKKRSIESEEQESEVDNARNTSL